MLCRDVPFFLISRHKKPENGKKHPAENFVRGVE